jgi:hypothetical protein
VRFAPKQPLQPHNHQLPQQLQQQQQGSASPADLQAPEPVSAIRRGTGRTPRYSPYARPRPANPGLAR